MKAELVHLLNANWNPSKALSPINCVPLKISPAQKWACRFVLWKTQKTSFIELDSAEPGSPCQGCESILQLQWANNSLPGDTERWCLSSFFNTLIQPFRGAQTGKYGKLARRNRAGRAESRELPAQICRKQQMSSVSTETQAVHILFSSKSIDKSLMSW